MVEVLQRLFEIHKIKLPLIATLFEQRPVEFGVEPKDPALVHRLEPVAGGNKDIRIIGSHLPDDLPERVALNSSDV